jgi:hypothetical protein
MVRPLEIFSEVESYSKDIILKCKIKNVPTDGRLVARAAFS